MPFAVTIGRLCEEFGYKPEEAIAAWRQAPVGFLEQVIEARAYMRTKAACDAYDEDPKALKRPNGPLAELVRAIEFEDAQACLVRS